MKKFFKCKLIILAVLLISIHTSFAAVHTINQSTGTVSIWESQYVNNMNEVWNINIGSDKLVKLSCILNIDTYGDFLSIYNVDNNGNSTLLTTITASTVLTTTIPNGRVKIAFSSDGEMCWSDMQLSGFQITFSADNSFLINDDAHVTGSMFIDERLGVGVMNPQESLHLAGAIRGPGGGEIRITSAMGKYIEIAPSGSIKTNSTSFIFDKPLMLSTGQLSSPARTNLNLRINNQDKLTIKHSNGYVGIGTTNPQFLLDVKGTIRATEIKVRSIDDFPDYVFESSYQLPDLKEVNLFIQKNKRLPNIPSAIEVKEKGISLVELQVKLLQKIEELTLYIIQQDKRILELEERLK